jgi:hypothetical protein
MRNVLVVGLLAVAAFGLPTSPLFTIAILPATVLLERPAGCGCRGRGPRGHSSTTTPPAKSRPFVRPYQAPPPGTATSDAAAG